MRCWMSARQLRFRLSCSRRYWPYETMARITARIAITMTNCRRRRILRVSFSMRARSIVAERYTTPPESERVGDAAGDGGVGFVAGMEAVEREPVVVGEEIGGLDDGEVRIGSETLEQLRVPLVHERRDGVSAGLRHERVVEADEDDAR